LARQKVSADISSLLSFLSSLFSPQFLSGGQYLLRWRNRRDGSEGECLYDAVVVAVPNEISNITFSSDIQKRCVLISFKVEIPLTFAYRLPPPLTFQIIHVTLIAGLVNSHYFGLDDSVMPEVILTTDNKSLPFNSLVAWKRISNGKYLYKVRK
jgi:hypothetical protein